MHSSVLQLTLKVKYFKSKVWKMCYKVNNQFIAFKYFYAKRKKLKAFYILIHFGR